MESELKIACTTHNTFRMWPYLLQTFHRRKTVCLPSSINHTCARVRYPIVKRDNTRNAHTKHGLRSMRPNGFSTHNNINVIERSVFTKSTRLERRKMCFFRISVCPIYQCRHFTPYQFIILRFFQRFFSFSFF